MKDKLLSKEHNNTTEEDTGIFWLHCTSISPSSLVNDAALVLSSSAFKICISDSIWTLSLVTASFSISLFASFSVKSSSILILQLPCELECSNS